MKPLHKQRYVYFARGVDEPQGRIKIGCSYLPAKRLEYLSMWSPYPLRIIAVAPGDFTIERQLHDYFAADRLHREWFRSSPELLFVIDQMARGASFEMAVWRLEHRAVAA